MLKSNMWSRVSIGTVPSAEVLKKADSEEFSKTVSWPYFGLVPSKSSEIGTLPKASVEPRCQVIVGRDHRIWEHIMPGDHIEALARVSSPHFPTRNREAMIHVFKIWEPSLGMLKLL